MKKILSALAFMLSIFCALQAGAYQIKADAQTARLPMGTKLELESASTVSTGTLKAGDLINAYLTKDIYSNDMIVLPKGTILRGSATKVVEAKRLSKGASLYINFDHIVAPNGKQLPIKAGLSSNFKLTADGGIQGGGNYGTALKENAQKSGKIITHSTEWGITSGEQLFHGGKYLVTPIAAAGGTIAGAGYLVGDSVIDLFRKGKNVTIKQGQKFEIMLVEPLDVPVF